MQITRLGHSALLFETADTRVLVDPGGFSDDWHSVTDLAAVMATHQHADHIDVDRLPGLLGANGDARLIVERAVADMVEHDAETAAVGETLQVGDFEIEVVGGSHAIIHEDIPRVGNVGYVFSDGSGPRVFHPGDSLTTIPDGIDVLAAPLAAPWSNVGATVDFVRAVGAERTFPIHDAIVSPAGRGVFVRLVSTMGDSEFSDPAIGEPFQP